MRIALAVEQGTFPENLVLFKAALAKGWKVVFETIS